MQKVTYINAYGESIVFGAQAPVLLRSVSGFSRPDAAVILTQGAYQAGAMFSRIQLPARTVDVQFDILPQESREALYRERMRIERVLSASRSEKDGEIGTLVYENDAGSFMARAVPDGAIAYGKRFQNAMAANRLSFLCPDAYLQGSAISAQMLRMSEGSFTLAASLPVRLGSRKFRVEAVNEGTAAAPLDITIYGTGETPTLINHTTGAQIVIERKIATGERLIIHTDPQALSCVLVHENGETEDAFGYLNPAAAVSAFMLVPGANDVEYLPSVASTGSRVELVWRARYEGV